MHALTQVLADNDGWGHMGGQGGGWMWLGGTLMMFFWVAVIAVVWLVARNRDRAPGRGTTRAHDILDERYARGELTTEEYRERLDQLR